MPSSTRSGIPPMRDPTTGTPAMKASWMTSGEFSSQSDGTTRTSNWSYTAALSSRSKRPMNRMDAPVARRRSSAV